MTTVSPNQASAEAGGIDASARCPLGLLTAFALLWLACAASYAWYVLPVWRRGDNG